MVAVRGSHLLNPKDFAIWCARGIMRKKKPNSFS